MPYQARGSSTQKTSSPVGRFARFQNSARRWQKGELVKIKPMLVRKDLNTRVVVL
jgi:hypothetical protein